MSKITNVNADRIILGLIVTPGPDEIDHISEHLDREVPWFHVIQSNRALNIPSIVGEVDVASLFGKEYSQNHTVSEMKNAAEERVMQLF